MHRHLVFAACLGLVASVWADDGQLARPPEKSPPEKTQPGKAPGLDQRLLESLDNDLFDGLDKLPPKPAAGGAERTRPDVDARLLDQLGEGEDLGEKVDPLTRIARQMRDVERRIAKQDTSRNTQRAQEQIVTDLNRMIEELQKQCQQCQGGQCNKPGSSAGNQASSSAAQSASRPSSQSTKRLGQADAVRAEATDRQEMLKAIWGQLPDRDRERLVSPDSIRFLPQYEKLIEDYYRRLAEERK